MSKYGEANLAANINSLVKQLEQTFKGTAAQKSFRESQKAMGLSGWLVERKQKSRFTAMVKEEYGGLQVLKQFHSNGTFVDRKVTQNMIDRAALYAHTKTPKLEWRRRLLTVGARRQKRDKYFRNMSTKAEEDLPNQSSWVVWHLQKQAKKREHN